MKIKLATINDYNKIKNMYQEVVQDMYNNNIDLWNEHYPMDVLTEDIESKRIYILEDNNIIISSFVLCIDNPDAKNVSWENNNSTAYYLERFCVHPQYKKQGIGKIMLLEAERISKDLNAEYLRFFVVDYNLPAIQFYEKNNYIKAKGINIDYQIEGKTLKEYGYEKKLLV